MSWSSLTVAVVILMDFQPSAARLAIETTSKAGNMYRLAEYNTKVTLACNVDDAELETAENPTYNWKWFKGDNRSTQRITADVDKVYQIEVAGNALTFNRFVNSNAGLYTCKLFDDNDVLVDAKVIYVALKPYVKLPKTATFNEGERMELECIVYGVPTPEISWRFENTTLVPSDRVSFLPDVITNINNAILVLDPIAVENSGNFYCTGKSAVVAKPVVSDPCNVLVKETTRPATVVAQDPAEWLLAVELAERQAVAAERRAIAAEQRAAAAEQRAAVAEQRAASAEQRATVAEKRATLAEQRQKSE